MRSLTPGASYRIRLHWATFGDGGGRGFFNFFEDAVHKSAFEQGKITGIIIANIVVTILLILSVIGIVGDLGNLVRYFKYTNIAEDLLAAYRTGGSKAATEVWKNRPTTINTDASGKRPIDMGSGPSIHEPTGGTGIAPRGQGSAPATGNEATTRATAQQIDVVTRRLLVAGPKNISPSLLPPRTLSVFDCFNKVILRSNPPPQHFVPDNVYDGIINYLRLREASLLLIRKGPPGRKGGDRVKAMHIAIDAYMDSIGFAKVQFLKSGKKLTDPDAFTDEEEFKNESVPRDEHQVGQQLGSRFSDRTYAYQRGQETLIIQTVTTQGKRLPGLLVPTNGEMAAASFIHQERPNVTIFLIPKLLRADGK